MRHVKPEPLDIMIRNAPENKTAEVPVGMSMPEGTPGGLPNCGIVAIAVLAGVSYAEALAAFPKRNGHWKGRTTTGARRFALFNLNREVDEHEWTPRMTLQRWMDEHATPGVTYFIRTSGHAQTVRNGHVIDQKGMVPISEYWGRRKFVKEMMTLKPKSV